jgi:ubiquinone/menaquinone biosynthesis C-methylase UbiE
LSKPSNAINESGEPKSIRQRIQNASFRLLYRFGGRIYDPLTRILFGGAWDRWRASVLPFLASGPILDLGCGTGVLVNQLNQMGYVAFGLDREPSMLRRVRSRTELRSCFVRGDTAVLPFQSASFVACVATFPSRFILQSNALDEVSRVLRPGGTFTIVLSGYTTDWPWYRQPIRLALRAFYGKRDGTSVPASNLITHLTLSGEWRWLSNGPDHVLIWKGSRTAASESAR